MPALGFASMFCERVERGEKLHSIRAPRKRPDQWLPGKTVHLFYGMRTKHCRRLGAGTITALHDIEIGDAGVDIDGVRIHASTELTAFARADGFLTWNEFVTFFRDHYGLPWRGVLIKWQLKQADYPTPTGGH